MAFPTAVNDQITDSVTQANVKVLGDAPAIAMGNLYQATAQALANAAHNATNAQQQSYVTAQAATTMGVATLYPPDPPPPGIPTTATPNSAPRCRRGAGSARPAAPFCPPLTPESSAHGFPHRRQQPDHRLRQP